MESHLSETVSIADIAAATFVTPRALQLAFRRHLNATPLEYLQRLRLAAAHEQLSTATSGDGQTVAAVAHRWGFAHPGRFAAALPPPIRSYAEPNPARLTTPSLLKT